MGKITAPDPERKIGEYQEAGQTFPLLHSLLSTVFPLARRKQREVLPVYRALTGDGRSRVDYPAALAVVQGAVQEAWYTCQGRPIPERCIRNQQERIEYAMSSDSTTNEGGATTKAPKIADLIREGLKEGKETAEILAELKAAFPESKADNKTVAYYRFKLRQEGLIAKRVKKGAAE